MKAGETGLEGPPVLRPGEVSEKKLYNTNIEDNAWCLERIIFKMYHTSIAGLRCKFGGHLPISSKKCPIPIQVVLGGSYAF